MATAGERMEASWPAHALEKRPWVQSQRGGTREDQTLRSTTVSLPLEVQNAYWGVELAQDRRARA
jgi:hypothetical protein